MVFKSILEHLPGFIKGVFTHTEEGVHEFLDGVESRIRRRSYQAKRFIAKSVIEVFLLLFGIGAFLLGLTVFISRFVTIDIVLLVTGIILVNIVLLTARFK
jgi:hypothetical protein